MNAKDAFRMARRVGGANLLDPAEAQALGRTLRQRPELDGFVLRVNLTDRELCLLEQPDASPALRFPVYPLPCGVMLVVPTLQVGGFQVRVAVPLFNEKALAWADWCIKAQRIRWLFDVDATNQTALADIAQVFPQQTTLRRLIARSRRGVDVAQLAKDMISVVPALIEDEAMASCVEHVPVRGVRLAIVSDFAEQFAAREVLEQHAGQSSNSTLH